MDSTTTLSPLPDLDITASGELPFELFDDDAVIPQALLVRVGDDRLAIPLEEARAVLRGRRIVRLPGAPAWVAGLVAVRGSLLPVAVLAARSAVPSVPLVPDWLVLVDHGGRSALLAVDVVEGVHVIESEAETLPERRAVRLVSHGAANAGASLTADVIDVAAVFRELFEED